MPRTYDRTQTASLYVKNIPEGAKSEELKSMFNKYGRVSDVYIPLDYYTRRPRGFAYVQYPWLLISKILKYKVLKQRSYKAKILQWAKVKTKDLSKAKILKNGFSKTENLKLKI